MKSFFKSLFGFSIGAIIGSLLSVIITPLLTNNISPSEYGKASVFLTLYIWIQSFIYLGLDQAYSREYNEHDNHTSLFQNAIFLPILVSIIICLVLCMFPSYFANIIFHDPNETRLVIVFGIIIILLVIERFVTLYIRMREKAFEFSVVNILLRLVSLLIAIFMLNKGIFTFHTVVYSQMLGPAITSLVLLMKYRKLFNFMMFKIDYNLIIDLLKFGIPVMISAIAFTSLNSIDRIFLAKYSTLEEIGVYQAVLKISGVIGIVKSAFTSFWIPTAYRWYANGKNIDSYRFISDVLMLILSLVFFTIILFKEIIIMIIGSGYESSIYIVGLITLTQLLYTASETTTLGIVFSKKSYLNLIVSIVSLGSCVIFNMFLTSKFGSVGAALSSSLSFLCFFALRTYFSMKNGFKFNILTQILVILFMFFIAILNAFYNVSITINLVLIFIGIFLQLKIIKELYLIIRKKHSIDLS